MRTRLRPGEILAAEVRRHWMVLGGPFALTLFLLGGLVGAWFVKRPYVAPVAGVALLVSGLWSLWRWLDWRCDLWAVTSERVIDESGVLSVRAEDSPLDKINNILCTQTMWGRILGYGTVNVQTAAEVGSTTIEWVARPMELKETIREQVERARDRSAVRQAAPFLAAAAAGRGGAGVASVAGGAGAIAGGTAGAGHASGGAQPARDELRECPYCAETIKARARVCRFCGRDL